jgi:hypothetical protein
MSLDIDSFRNHPKTEAKPGQRFLILKPLRGTKRTSALVDQDMCVRVFTSRKEADREATKCGGKVVDVETMEEVT